MQFQQIFWPLPTSKRPFQCQLDCNSSGGIGSERVCVCMCVYVLESGRVGLRPSPWHISDDKHILAHLFHWMLWRWSWRRGVVVHWRHFALKDRYVCCWGALRAIPTGVSKTLLATHFLGGWSEDGTLCTCSARSELCGRVWPWTFSTLDLLAGSNALLSSN